MNINPAKIRNRLLQNVGLQTKSAKSFASEGETSRVSPSPASTTDILKNIGGNSGIALITTSFDRFIKEQHDVITAMP